MPSPEVAMIRLLLLGGAGICNKTIFACTASAQPGAATRANGSKTVVSAKETAASKTAKDP